MPDARVVCLIFKKLLIVFSIVIAFLPWKVLKLCARELGVSRQQTPFVPYREIRDVYDSHSLKTI